MTDLLIGVVMLLMTIELALVFRRLQRMDKLLDEIQKMATIAFLVAVGEKQLIKTDGGWKCEDTVSSTAPEDAGVGRP